MKVVRSVVIRNCCFSTARQNPEIEPGITEAITETGNLEKNISVSKDNQRFQREYYESR